MNVDILLSALIIGALGAGHCLGMCGGIAGALTFAVDKEDKVKRSAIMFAYNAGRILSYALIGAVAAFFASLFEQMGFPYFRIIAALLLVLMGLYISGIWKALVWLEKLGAQLWRFIQPMTKRWLPVKHVHSAFFLGCLWGWLPCGLVYTALAFASAQADAAYGALVMFAFGVGTLPAVLLSGFAADFIRQLLQGKGFRYFSALLLIAFGIWTYLGAIGHAHHASHGEDRHHPTQNNNLEHEHHHH